MPSVLHSWPRTLILPGYALLIAAGSLYPYSGWESGTGWPIDFMFAPLPRYITRTDITTNLLLYLPLGYLVALRLFRPRGRTLAILAAILAAGLFSLILESIQGLLASRIASNLDVYINTAGGGIGALLALHHGRALRAWRAMYRWRLRWFRPHGANSAGLWLLLLWGVSQFALLPMPGAGWLDLHLRPLDMPPERLAQINLTWLFAVFMEMAAVGAFATTLLKPGRHAGAVFLFFPAAFALKLFAATFLLRLKAMGGILSLETLTGFIAALWFLLLPVVARHRHAIAFVLIAAIAAGRLLLAPAPLWPGGSLLNIVGLASHIAALWPWAALAQLAWAGVERRRERRGWKCAGLP